jgi:6-pyruvoyltetrahydropterin/6-carboxytetrahydropterin synthase
LTEEENRELYGTLYSEFGHGHNYILEAYLRGPIDPVTGMVINLRELDALLKQVTGPLDHHHLNHDVAHFKNRVPTTENIAAFCFDEIQRQVPWPDVELVLVRLYEGADLWADVARADREQEVAEE